MPLSKQTLLLQPLCALTHNAEGNYFTNYTIYKVIITSNSIYIYIYVIRHYGYINTPKLNFFFNYILFTHQNASLFVYKKEDSVTVILYRLSVSRCSNNKYFFRLHVTVDSRVYPVVVFMAQV